MIDPAEHRAGLKSLQKLLAQAEQDPTRLPELLAASTDIPEYLKQGLTSLLSDDEDNDEDAGAGGDPWDAWHPMHSMHLPGEVQQMLAEVKLVEQKILASDIEGVREQCENDLLPTLERLAEEDRMLFVQVDT